MIDRNVWWLLLTFSDEKLNVGRVPNSSSLSPVPLFRGIMTSEKRVQKFHTDDVPLLRSDWLKQISRAALNQLGALSRPGQLTHHRCGISALDSLTSFLVETRVGVAECGLFPQVKFNRVLFSLFSV